MPAASRVAPMFGSIARRYDVANFVLSAGIYLWWRWVLFRMLDRCYQNGGGAALDVCTGTGHLLSGLQKRFRRVVGIDFCKAMLDRARLSFPQVQHLQPQGLLDWSREGVTLLQADALALPFQDRMFDVVTVAYGVRNLENREKGLQEMFRVLKQDGRLFVLEFGQPRYRLFARCYRWYARTILPALGGWLTGNRQAYSYLEDTSGKFPCGEQFCAELRAVGFSEIRSFALTGGIAYLYTASAA